jgi:hypothetical protein
VAEILIPRPATACPGSYRRKHANYAASINNFIGGYDANYGDPRGTFLYLNAMYQLH